MSKGAIVHFEFEVYSDNMHTCDKGMLEAVDKDIDDAAEWLEKRMASNPKAELGEIRLVLFGMPCEKRCVVQYPMKGGVK